MRAQRQRDLLEWRHDLLANAFEPKFQFPSALGGSAGLDKDVERLIPRCPLPTSRQGLRFQFVNFAFLGWNQARLERRKPILSPPLECHSA